MPPSLKRSSFHIEIPRPEAGASTIISFYIFLDWLLRGDHQGRDRTDGGVALQAQHLNRLGRGDAD